MKTLHALALAALALLAVAARSAEPEEKIPIGAVLIELADRTIIKGMLLDITDDTVMVRTPDGDRKIDRKRVRKLDPLQEEVAVASKPAAPRAEAPAVAEADNSDALKIGRTVKPPVEDDLEDEPARPAKPKAAPGASEQNLLARLKAPADPAAAEKAVAKESSKEPIRTPSGKILEGKEFEAALSSIDFRDYKRAAGHLRAVVSRGVESEIARCDTQARQRYNRSLGELLVMCYVLQQCAPCKGEGSLRCTGCNGTGYLYKNIPTAAATANANTGPKTVSEPGTARSRVAVCEQCRGNGYEICMGCRGTRMVEVDPTPYEREAYCNYCMRLAVECLGTSEGTYGDTPREALPTIMPNGDAKIRQVIEQTWLRDSLNRCKSDINRLWRAEGFYRMAMHADPALAIRYTSKDLTQELNKITIRRQHLYGELAERARFKDFHMTE